MDQNQILVLLAVLAIFIVLLSMRWVNRTLLIIVLLLIIVFVFFRKN